MVSVKEGKYALICALEIQKIQMVVHIFSGFMYLHSAELNVVAVTENVNSFLLV